MLLLGGITDTESNAPPEDGSAATIQNSIDDQDGVLSSSTTTTKKPRKPKGVPPSRVSGSKQNNAHQTYYAPKHIF